MIAARIRPRCQSLMSRLFLHRPSVAADSAHFADVVRRFGIEDPHVVKTRRDTKVIARGIHPEWGAVAVKAIDPIASPAIAYQGLHADGIVAGNPSPLLPRIHSFGLGYSISEWISGKVVRAVEPSRFATLPFARFADDLAIWCSNSGETGVLNESQVLATLRFYIGVTVRRMQYRSAATCLSASVKFLADRGRLGSWLDSMAAFAPQLRLQRTSMLSDLHPLNVIYDEDRDRLVYVDYEPIRPGNYMFDMVFLLSFLLAIRSPQEATDALARHIFSPRYMECLTTRRFFTDFASYIVATYMTIDGQERDAIEENLEAIRTYGG